MPTTQDLQAALLMELGLENLSKEAREEAIAAIAGPVLQSVTLAILQKLPDEAVREQFHQALISGDRAVVEDLIIKYIPGSTAFIEEEVRKAIASFKAALAKQP